MNFQIKNSLYIYIYIYALTELDEPIYSYNCYKSRGLLLFFTVSVFLRSRELKDKEYDCRAVVRTKIIKTFRLVRTPTFP